MFPTHTDAMTILWKVDDLQTAFLGHYEREIVQAERWQSEDEKAANGKGARLFMTRLITERLGEKRTRQLRGTIGYESSGPVACGQTAVTGHSSRGRVQERSLPLGANR